MLVKTKSWSRLREPMRAETALALTGTAPPLPLRAHLHSNDLAHDMAAVRGEGPNLARPAAFFHGFRPFLAEQHVRTVDLVECHVVGLAAAVKYLTLAIDREGGRLGLHATDRTHARHFQQQRHVLGVIDLVEQRFLFLRHVHADHEQIFRGNRHYFLPWKAAV